LIIGQAGAPADAWAFWAIFGAWVAGECWLQRSRPLPAGAADRDQGSRWVLVAAVWTAVAAGMAAAVVVPGARIPLATQAVFTAGLVLMAAGIGVRGLAVAALGSDFSVTIGTEPGQRVRDRGPYRWVRHPSYAGSLATVTGILLCCTNLIALGLLILPILGYAHRIRVEEAALLGGLGEAYRAYMRRTKRLIPFLL